MKTLICGDALEELKKLPDQHVQTVVTSPPYWGLRDYGVEGQLGDEPNPIFYLQNLMDIFRQIKRILKNDGTLWLNLGDSYLPDKNLAMIPARMAIAMQEDGWILRSDNIWHKRNPKPEGAKDRTSRVHEYFFLFAKQRHYKYDGDSIKEPLSQDSLNQIRSHYKGKAQKNFGAAGAENPSNIKKKMIERWNEKLDRGEKLGVNKKSVWCVKTAQCDFEHFAAFPHELILPCVLAGSSIGDTVLDPFNGTGTTGLVALELQRSYIGIDINQNYLDFTENRLRNFQLNLFERADA